VVTFEFQVGFDDFGLGYIIGDVIGDPDLVNSTVLGGTTVCEFD
jgi:hypothetical protein